MQIADPPDRFGYRMAGAAVDGDSVAALAGRCRPVMHGRGRDSLPHTPLGRDVFVLHCLMVMLECTVTGRWKPAPYPVASNN
ncbi:protein of unknown function [Ralstonia solanacearum CFBP2957]|nr:protein of unknown function [Ralstonia solanacearum CFBP2957]